MSLRRQTINGIKWQVGASFTHKAISFITTIIIARILGPAVYGLFAFALTIVTAFELFKSLGVDAALIRRQDDFEIAADTAFIIIPCLGLLLYLILNISAPIIGRLFNNQTLISVIKVLGIVFVVNSFTRVPAICLERNMQFAKISIAELVGMTLFSISAIAFTFLKLGVWALVYAYIVKSVVYMFLIYYYAKWKPSIRFNSKLALEMLNFGKYIFIGYLLWFLKMSLDNILVGKLLGVTALGLYAVSFNISNFSADYISNQIHRVTYPAYSKMQDNLGDMAAAFKKVLTYTCIIVLPFAVGVLMLGNEFIAIAYGEKWVGVMKILKIMSFIGAFNSLGNTGSAIFLALKKPKYNFWLAFIQVAMFFAFIIPAANKYGLNGVGLVVLLTSLVALIFHFYWIINLIPVTLKQIISCIKPGLYGSIVMSLVIIICKLIIITNTNSSYLIVLFMSNLLLAIITYGYVLYLMDSKILIEIKNMVIPNSNIQCSK